MAWALEDFERETRREGYEEGCADGYRKALDDVLDLIGDEEPWTIKDLFAEVQRMRENDRSRH